MHATDSELDKLGGLIELCEAQATVISSLQAALAQRDRDQAERQSLQSSIAHELRTPLTAVIGTLYTLALPNLTPDKATDLISRATRQAEQLHELVEDLLRTGHAHNELLPRASQEVISVAELLDDVTIAVSSRFDLDRLTCDVPSDLAIRTHPSRLRQIHINLLVNAAKYTPLGSPVRLEVDVLDEAIRFDIVDSGPGIAPDLVDSLFEPFRQGPGGTRAGGLGLGLYLVKGLVGSLGGEVKLLPNPHGGTIARVELPQQRTGDLRRASVRRRAIA
jgi:signal transduction histidine kinase